MKVKIDTKEKFHTITIEDVELSANMTVELDEKLLFYTNEAVNNVVLDMMNVSSIDEQAAERLALIQQAFYDKNCSFVICKLQMEVEKLLDKMDLLEILNVTPTESEAWDIVQMEEIERELIWSVKL